jgi:hypothetical protein
MIDTPALRALQETGLSFRIVRTRPAGNPQESAELQGIELGSLLRTLVVRRGDDDFLFVLVLGASTGRSCVRISA